MKRVTAATILVGMLTLTAAPALAQEGQTEPGKAEPDRIDPAWALYISEYLITVEGKDAHAFRAGSDATLRLTLFNGGEERARDISLRLRNDNASVEILEGRATLPDLAPGDSAKATFKVRALEQDCIQDGAMKMQIASSLGTRDEYVGAQVLCPGPNVYPGEIRYVGGDGDNVPEPGERLEVFVTLYNYGRDAATDVLARIKINNPDVTVLEASSSWSNIQPEDGTAAIEPFVIQIADRAEVQDNSCGASGGGTEPARGDGDEAVSSDGEVVVADDAPASDGGANDGGGSSGNTGSEPSRVEPAPAPKEDPGTVEPAPAPAEEPGKGEPAPEPYVEPDPAVAFEAAMTITASGKEFESAFGTQMYCLMESEGRPASGGAARDDVMAVGGDASGELGLPVGASAPSRTTPVAAAGALLALVAGGLLFRRSLAAR